MPEKKAYLFDLDGTLVDSVPDLADATNHVLKTFGCSPTTVDQVKSWIGQGAGKILKQAFAAAHRSAVPEDALDVLIDYYQANVSQGSEVYSGVFQGLSALQKRGHPMAVVTNKYRHLAVPLLEDLKLMPFFGVVVGGSCADKPKPWPHPILLACQSLGVDPEQAVMVGDSYNDQAAAEAAGSAYYQVTYGYGDGTTGLKPPDTIDSISELV